jgi:hypothetical protein
VFVKVDDQFDVDDGWTGTVNNLTLQTTSTTSSYKSMIEVGGGIGLTSANLNNVNYLTATANVAGILPGVYYVSTEFAINIKGSNNIATFDGVYVMTGSAMSSNTLMLAIPADGPYTYSAMAFGLTALTVPAAGITVKANNQLVLAAGAIVSLGGMIVIEAGGRLVSRGTSSQPITYNGVLSQSGVLLLGGSGDATDTNTFTDIPSGTSFTPVYNDKYGGSKQPVNVITYSTFANVGNNVNDINALSLVGLNAAHIINNLKVTDAQDDGIEIFAGSVNLNNIMIMDSVSHRARQFSLSSIMQHRTYPLQIVSSLTL